MNTEYFAGFFDGEGCISITNGTRKNPTPRVTVGQVQSNSKVLRDFKERWGGSFYLIPRQPPQRPHAMWYLSGRGLIKFLKDMRPFLQQKRLQCDIALVMAHMIKPKPGKKPEGESWLRRRLARALGNLNHGRGPADGEEFLYE